MRKLVIGLLVTTLLCPLMAAELSGETASLRERIRDQAQYSEQEKVRLQKVLDDCLAEDREGEAEVWEKRMESRMLMNKLREGMAKGAGVADIERAMLRTRDRLQYSDGIAERFASLRGEARARLRQCITLMQERGIGQQEIDELAREAGARGGKAFQECLATVDELQGKGMGKRQALKLGKEVAKGKLTREQARERLRQRQDSGHGWQGGGEEDGAGSGLDGKGYSGGSEGRKGGAGRGRN